MKLMFASLCAGDAETLLGAFFCAAFSLNEPKYSAITENTESKSLRNLLERLEKEKAAQKKAPGQDVAQAFQCPWFLRLIQKDRSRLSQIYCRGGQ
jgi:hypothetical protein